MGSETTAQCAVVTAAAASTHAVRWDWCRAVEGEDGSKSVRPMSGKAMIRVWGHAWVGQVS